MNRYKHFFCVAILASFFVALSPVFAETMIHGVVINGSDNQNLAGVNVELRRNTSSSEQGKLIATTVSAAGGKFSFNVPLSEHDSFLVAIARYKGFPYEVPAYDGGKRLGQFNVEIDSSKVTLPVFETTTSLVPLSFTAHHLEIASRPGGIKCVERLLVHNPTKKTFLGLGKNNATVLLALPEGAKNVTLDSSLTNAKLVKNPGGYSVAMPILPTLGGDATNIIVNYEMDWPSKLPWTRSLDLTREIQYPTSFFFVQRFDSERGLRVQGSRITDKGKEPLSSDQTVQLNISGEAQNRVINAIGSPQSEEDALVPGDKLQIEASNPINPTFWVFLGFLLFLIILIPLSLWRRSAAVSPNEIKSDKIGEPVIVSSVYPEASDADVVSTNWLQTPEAQHLVEQIAALDEAYAAGEIEKVEYEAKRDVSKRALLYIASQDNSAT